MLKRPHALFAPLAAIPFLFMAGSCNTSNGMDNKNGYVQIFDGKTLKGWEADGTHWRVENGNLVGEVTPATAIKTNNFIIWKGGLPANFELTLEFRISKDGNSGINYRSETLPDIPYALKGYQADIDGANHYTGQNYEERGRTTLAYRGQKTTIPPPTTSLQDGIKNNAWTAAKPTASLGNSDSLQRLIKSEDWNKCHLVIKGNHLQHYINGVLMSDVTDNDKVNGKSKGLLGLQVHVGPPMKVEYRNIMLKQK
ncbi:uncharacterized protein DUF1080 [Chitinophaga niastensis]|uniref:Uncharacterized protein DUF1080 n=1 Tax=Chitinophaga niastensis TaxID=536980 RepID=A0A2P8HA54_CHINA|nr:DUF1080 domain-containing protein [Chitinophaga niastensis]PSL43113.1 uncharacterized protein DUF1080 [Chitinophaga niastensis]